MNLPTADQWRKLMIQKFRKIDNIADWRKLLDQSKFKTFFHDLDWETFLENEFRWIEFGRYLYEDSMLLSLAVVKKAGREKFLSAPFCEYGGPLPLAENVDLGTFLADAVNHFGANMKINFHPALAAFFVNAPQFAKANGEIFTYWLDWRNEPAVNYIGSLRKTLRRGLQALSEQDWLIGPCQKEKELREFYRIYLANMRQKKNLAFPYSFFDFFHNSQNSLLILARRQGKVFAGSVFLQYGDFCHYFLNAGLPEANPSPLILFKEAERCGAEKKLLDLGATRAGSSLETFKEGWRGQKIPIFQFGKSNEKMRNSRLRNLWRFMPGWAVERASGILLKKSL